MSTPEPDPSTWEELDWGVEPGLYDQVDEAAEEAAIQEAEQAIAEGRVISHEAVMRWVASWGTPDEQPRT